MSIKDQKLSELTGEAAQESLHKLCKRLGIKMLFDDPPLYEEALTKVLKSFSKDNFMDEENEKQNTN
ncbi:MAG: hypothetical protein ACJ0HB_00895 [Gammaproteobacteria bacterium]